MLRSPATREAANLVLSQWHRGRMNRLQTWHATHAQWPAGWIEASVESTTHLRVTKGEFQQLHDELLEIVTEWSERLRGRRDPDLVDVEVQINAFPVGDPAGLREPPGSGGG